MSLSLEIVDNLCGFSLAKYSTWFYYKPDNLLLDVGEGVSVTMRNMIFGINTVLISHGHADHISGLPGLLSSRASSMGDTEKAINIYYPKADRNIAKIYRYIKETIGKVPYEIVWKEISPGDRLPLSGNRYLEAFASKHIDNTLSLGYKIAEERNRLKACYRDIPQKELIQIIQSKGKKEITETYTQNLLCFSGDSMPLDQETVQSSEVLLHDATFLKLEDREENTHATVEEVIQLAKASNVSALCLFHLSARYRYQEIIEGIQQYLAKYEMKIPVFLLYSFYSPLSFKKIQ
ncbi:MAG: MBL fold metallo-hydrolase [Candidatus Brocadiae bacterium]|nr:MBL fold metallo-hydrolase [Candidatus Brocadiia bacterium]